MNSFIQKAFPVPRALYLADVSVDTTDGELRFFELERKAGHLKPKRCGVLPFPRLNGKESPDALLKEAAAALKSFASGRGYQTVQCIIHEGDVYVFKVKVPTVVVTEVSSAIEAVLEENVPITPAEAIFEYEIMSIDKRRGETTVAVFVVSEKILERYHVLLGSGSLTPVSFEAESRSIARALIQPGDALVHAVLCIRSHHSVVFIVEKGKVVFSSSIEVGSTDVDSARTKALEATGGSIDDAMLFDSLLPVFSTLRDELGKVLNYYKTASKKDETPLEIKDVILMGATARIAGFARYISITAKLPTRIGSVWTNVLSIEKNIPELDEKSSLDYASLIGMYL